MKTSKFKIHKKVNHPIETQFSNEINPIPQMNKSKNRRKIGKMRSRSTKQIKIYDPSTQTALIKSQKPTKIQSPTQFNNENHTQFHKANKRKKRQTIREMRSGSTKTNQNT